MRTISLICFIVAQYSIVNAQKPILDTAALNDWVSLGNRDDVKISDDGKYFIFYLTNNTRKTSTLVIQSIDGRWKKEFPEGMGGLFTESRTMAIFMAANKLYFVNLGGDNLQTEDSVASFQHLNLNHHECIVYLMRNNEETLVLRDLKSGDKRQFKNVKDYSITDNGTSLVFREVVQNSDRKITSLCWVGLTDNVIKRMWSCESTTANPSELIQYVVDPSGKQVAFIVRQGTNDHKSNVLWYYRTDMETATPKVDHETIGVARNLFVSESYLDFSFTLDGKNIIFDLTETPPSKVPDNAVSLDVWNYKDVVLQSTQLRQTTPKMYLSSINSRDSIVITIVGIHETIEALSENKEYAIVAYNEQDMDLGGNNLGDRFWLRQDDKYYLVSLIDGSRVQLKTSGCTEFNFSPDGKYLIYFDSKETNDYFSYDLTTRKCLNISKGIPSNTLRWSNEYYPEETKAESAGSFGLAAWEENNKLLVYDEFDLWRLDLKGVEKPYNITHGFGRRKLVKLKLIDDYADIRQILLPLDTSLLISAYNIENKYNGFYKLNCKRNEKLDSIYMGPYTFYKKRINVTPPSDHDFDMGMKPLRAKNRNLWITIKQSGVEAPNYVLTTDFQHFKYLTTYQPQNRYNWLSTELIAWQQPDGIRTKGVLFKPENFDPNKRYPVIITYYQQLSNLLYEYPSPSYTNSADINIPWFVSQGYIVFTPDIYYHYGELKKSACTTIESAARMLSDLTYIDSSKIGISGHSWGGAETNYIVTHTHLFAAALSGAAGHDGVDMISNSLSINESGKSQIRRYEQDDIGFTLWQRPDLWIQNSPIFQSNEITTPFLILYNKNDYEWLRAVEFFIALRRLNKKVWMLQYDNGDHSVDGKDAVDFTIRVNQFFDYYLKRKLPPKWMTEGIRSADKGIIDGLKLDTSNVVP